MVTPPEEVFDEFFRGRSDYWGRKDSTAVPELMRSFLIDFRESVNLALQNAENNNPLFYFDFIDSDVSNALAFRYEGYSFIGVTFPLLDEIVATCKKLVESHPIVNILHARGNTVPYDLRKLSAVLVRIQLLFAASHEYVHHKNGHLIQDAEPTFLNEIINAGEAGNLDRQACEIDADGGAVLFVLLELLNGALRLSSVNMLALDAEPVNIQDEALLLCLVVAVGGFFFIRPPVALNGIRDIFDLTHPPQSLRMLSVISFAVSWCQQFRPGLEAVMMEENWVLRLMNAVADATWGDNRESDWRAQVALMFSDLTTEYSDEIRERVDRIRRPSPRPG